MVGRGKSKRKSDGEALTKTFLTSLYFNQGKTLSGPAAILNAIIEQLDFLFRGLCLNLQIYVDRNKIFSKLPISTQ